jgi:hypothetical protein
MFNQNSLESFFESKTNEVTIVDIGPVVMQKFLDFIVGKDINLTDAKEAAEMLMAADKYNVTGLAKFCAHKVPGK